MMQTFDKNRVINFSDAIFSIAATILVLDLAVPGRKAMLDYGVSGLLENRIPAFIGFFVSFFVIVLFWRAHMRNLSFAKTIDSKLLSINTFTLLFIVLLPFSTGLYVAGFDMASAFRLYCLNIIALGVCNILSIRRVFYLAPSGSSMTRQEMNWFISLGANVILVWGLAALAAAALPELSRWLFFLIFVFDYFINRYWRPKIG